MMQEEDIGIYAQISLCQSTETCAISMSYKQGSGEKL